MLERMPYEPRADEDDWTSTPNGGAWTAWGLGIGVAAVLVYSGLEAIWAHDTIFNGSQASEHLRGTAAVAAGVAECGLAGLLFCHYFIQHWRPMAWYAVIGKIIGLLAIIGGLGFYAARSFLGWH